MSIQMNVDALLRRFGRDVRYNDESDIRGIYDETIVDSGGVDSVAETLKIKETDFPDLAKDDTFEFYVGESLNTYKAKSFNPQRTGFIAVILELQP